MNTNEYLGLDFQDITALLPSSRREFLKRFGGGIVILFSVADLSAQEAGRQRGFRPQAPSDFNALLRVGENGRVTCHTGKVELGQGIITSLAQMVAEELEISLDSVDMVMGDTDQCPWDMGTFGSMTTRFFGPTLRAAAAEAKAVLLELASEALKIPPAQLRAKDGVIVDQANSRNRVSYGQLAKGKRIERHLQGRPHLKETAQFTFVGQPVLRRDAREKVTGQAKYAGDIRLPGQLYARILRPPAHGAKLKSVDTEPAKQIDGVQIIHEGDWVVVLHELPDRAEAALARIKAEFETPSSNLDENSIFTHLLNVAPNGNVIARGGDVAEGQKLARSTVAKTYFNSYVAHAAMETHTALAAIEGDKATVWASTQSPFSAQSEIARAIGFPAQKVRVITPYVGGGFGGKTQNSQAVEAARLAKLAGKPVQVAWSRAEEFFYDTFRPAAMVKINAGIDPAGKLVFWDYDVFYAGERGAPQFYATPHHRTAAHGSGWQGPPGSHPFATGAWRAPGNNTNTFARESHVDLMAEAAGMDPVEFRLKNLADARMIQVLKTAAEHWGWQPAKPGSGRGYGVACGMDAGTYVAAIAEVKVDPKKGTAQVKRVVCAQDMGVVINPAGAKIQMEGCITMGLGYALSEEIHFKGGNIADANFGTYEIPRFSWLPQIETVIVSSKESAPQGGGEPAIILMGALIANAIHDATGARLYQLPMTPARVKEAIQRA